VWVLVGDGTYLMMSGDLATAVQERLNINLVIIDNHGFGSIGGLSEGLGSTGFGTRFRLRDGEQLGEELLPVNFAAHARALGAVVFQPDTLAELQDAMSEAAAFAGPTAIVVECDREARVPGYESWWDVPVAEVSTMPSVKAARAEFEANVVHERHLHALDPYAE
jgi:3D-(3,5/4)-trihydroxycyclohexane-1,2-dione acylhydrolase (decyclizing)